MDKEKKDYKNKDTKKTLLKTCYWLFEKSFDLSTFPKL